MNDHLPPTNIADKIDVFDVLALHPLERVTAGLRRGFGYDLRTLAPLANRCRALADAYDARVSDEMKTKQEAK